MNGDTPQKPEDGSWEFHANTTAPEAPKQPVTAQPTTPASTAVPQNDAVTPAQQQEPSTAPQSDEDAQFMSPAFAATTVAAPEDIMHDVTWSASEYLAHEKSPLWYLILAAAVVVLIAIVYFVTKDTIAVITIGLIAILFAVLAARKPRVLQYTINAQGISIGNHLYPYHEFKSFGVVTQGAFSNVVLIPLKRFMPSLSIYYPPEDEERIVDALSHYLPFAPVTPDLIDRTMFRIRF